ncbi:hypothetical protein, partial [Opacimonas viscosa]
ITSLLLRLLDALFVVSTQILLLSVIKDVKVLIDVKSQLSMYSADDLILVKVFTLKVSGDIHCSLTIWKS